MYKHLKESVIPDLELPMEERITRIQAPRWVGYPKAKNILQKLEDLLVYPKSHRMPNFLIVGDTNNGKTMLVQRFRSLHPAVDNANSDGIIAPVIAIQAPPVPDEGRFYSAILDQLFAPYNANARVDSKQFQVVKLLRYVNLKVLVIDEIHHILAGNLNKQRAFLNVIKFLGNEIQVPIVGVGTRDAFQALQTDPQLSNRFEPALLPRWELNADFRRLLVSFEQLIPLKEPSDLQSPQTASKIYSLTEGYIGEISRLLNRSAVASLRVGGERINLDILEKLDWIGPSDRKRQIEAMT